MQRAAVTAVLGPTNTGKTHLAVERLCGHASGMMGFPLRLLAREIYDRVVAIKGPKEVGLITGEEKIMPEGARWLLCTAESMPLTRDTAFVALDEAQLGADAERGHIFTDRLLNMRGREETMILGSESLTPMVRALVPEAEIITRPRFSKLSYAGAKKLSRLPPRSAIIAFSADEVYAIAELLRRTRGGSAVVMGALSPRTRNAQVDMYQAGEVDYLVATDAIGMGLNMDVGHIAFASLSKFDGKRQRRLHLAEMAQIAGRAGRHQRDGTFGTLAGKGEAALFTDSEIERIEAHRFAPLDHLYWRNGEPDYGSLSDLIESLEIPPATPQLRAAPEAIDLAVLKQLASEAPVIARATNASAIARLWEVCGLPDFRKTGADYHARLVARLFDYRVTGAGHIPAHIIAEELARLDSVTGDIDTIAARIASTRTWAYAAQRADWLADPARWAAQAAAVEEKLSDALHARLTERFVDRRTTMLMRSTGADPNLLDVTVGDDGRVMVEGEEIGKLTGFRFAPDAQARLGDRKALLAAAEARLPRELARRAERLIAAPDRDFALIANLGEPLGISWAGYPVAALSRGRAWFRPIIAPASGLDALPPHIRERAKARLETWMGRQTVQRLRPLSHTLAVRDAADTPASLRAMLSQLLEAAGVIGRDEAGALALLDAPARKALRDLGYVVGTLDVFHPLLLKPEATRLRMSLLAAYQGKPMPPLPLPGLGLLDMPAPALADAALVAGYRGFGNQMLRIDLVERIARSLHDQRQKQNVSTRNFVPDQQQSVSLGVGAATLTRIMRALGFVSIGDPAQNHWRWHGRRSVRPDIRPDNPAFAALKPLSRKADR